ncbi:MAG: ABC transporter permease [Chloroflexota bacterium]
MGFDIISMLAMTLRMATPITLGSLGGMFSERSGVVNIAIEGMMLSAAFTGFAVAAFTQNLLIGLITACLTGAAMALLHAVLSIRFKTDQIISGTVINILAIGFTGYLDHKFFSQNPPPGPGTLPDLPIPLLADVPVVGQILFHHQPLVYTSVILVVVAHFVLFYTPWGLRTRAVGEHPRAADTLGVNVFLVRYVNVLISGVLAGLGGAFLSLEAVGHFEVLMTSGRGFIALAALIFGKWTPFGAFGAALLFGGADALQLKIQGAGADVPYQLLSMLPYVVTMIALAGVIGRSVAPAAIGQPYEK